jgi:hypothetical protein
MRKENLKTKKLAITVLSFLLLSGILMTAVSAAPWPNLPASPVTLEITNMTPWTFPFVIALSNVPGGYDVSNGAYTGWCVDLTHGIQRGTEYQMNLYSSLSPPAEVSSVQWDMINYILNHKDAGTGADIQDALWYFINGGAYFTSWGIPHTTSATTEAIVADALANGAGYTPGIGDTLAIICLPTGTPEERAQMLVIELTIPSLATRTWGFWKTHTTFTENIFDDKLGSSIQIDSSSPHAKTIDSYAKLFGAFEANVAKTSTGAHRTAIDSARISLLHQLLAAILNGAAGAQIPIDSVTGKDLITAANQAYSGTSRTEIIRIAGLLDSFNSGGDNVPFPAGLPAQGNATPQISKSIASGAGIAYWDVL